MVIGLGLLVQPHAHAIPIVFDLDLVVKRAQSVGDGHVAQLENKRLGLGGGPRGARLERIVGVRPKLGRIRNAQDPLIQRNRRRIGLARGVLGEPRWELADGG